MQENYNDMENHNLSIASQQRYKYLRYDKVKKCLISALKLFNK